MTEPQQRQTLRTDDEATLVVSGEETARVAPRFDDEETLVARPVVPLEADAHDPAHEQAATRPAHKRRSPYGPRRSWMLALVLVSVLVGGVLGGAGLYLYQRQSQDPAVSPAAVTQQPAADPAPAPAAEGAVTTPPEAPAQQTESPSASIPNAVEPARPVADKEVPAAPAREPESVPAVERREAPAVGGSTGTPKRGKKGERDQEIERRDAPRPAGNVARASDNGVREARRVDSIYYRPRRAARRERARRDDAPDRLRRIFEGAPE